MTVTETTKNKVTSPNEIGKKIEAYGLRGWLLQYVSANHERLTYVDGTEKIIAGDYIIEFKREVEREDYIC